MLLQVVKRAALNPRSGSPAYAPIQTNCRDEKSPLRLMRLALGWPGPAVNVPRPEMPRSARGRQERIPGVALTKEPWGAAKTQLLPFVASQRNGRCRRRGLLPGPGVNARGTRSGKAPNAVDARLDGFGPNVKL